MNVLGIETSCDETAAAVARGDRRVLAGVISSQVNLHRPYGGVVPELASRAHLQLIVPVILKALDRAGMTLNDLGAVAVTVGPGLAGALLVGVGTARALARALDVPVIGVNHLEAHLYANMMPVRAGAMPAAALVVSGGHTELVIVEALGRYRVLGRTRDDAAGEAFDKVCKILGLGYPGGPIIDSLSRKGKPERFPLPRPYMEGSWDFSFSGLKTAVLYGVNRASGGGLRRGDRPGSEQAKRLLGLRVEDVAASFQAAVVDVLVRKLMRAARATGARSVWLAGGVAANRLLRARTRVEARRMKLKVSIPPVELCTDNAAMVAALGGAMLRAGYRARGELDADPNLRLESWRSV